MYRRLSSALLLSLSLKLLALPDDAYQPIKIQADSAIRQEKQGITRYQGSVVMQQGSLQLQADNITLKNDAQQNLQSLTATGTPARFQQQPATDKTTVFAEANHIIYLPDEGKVELTGNAFLHQGDAQVSSERIVYLTNEQVFKAENKPSDSQGSSRVEVIIPARPKQPEPQP